MRRAVLLLWFACSTAFSASLVVTPEQVSASVDKQGAHAYLASLDDKAVDALLDRISSGKSAWVALAPKLAPGADAANAEGLGIALAYALPRNAAAVLKAIDPIEGDSHILSVSRVCGIPFIDEPPPSYKRDALRAVAAVKAKALQEVKKRCMATLKKS